MRKVALWIGVAVVLGWSSGAFALPIQWTVAEGGNDHWYEFVDSGQSIAWTEAKVAAEQRGGYLAVVTSQAEDDWIHTTVVIPEFPAHLAFASTVGGPWIGGYDDPTNGWSWVNGEPWSFLPSVSILHDGGYLHYWRWEDASGSGLWWSGAPTSGEGVTDLSLQWSWYVAEYDTNPIPEPSTALLLGLGLTGLAASGGRRDRS